jgi:hypothetical protein
MTVGEENDPLAAIDLKDDPRFFDLALKIPNHTLDFLRMGVSRGT